MKKIIWTKIIWTIENILLIIIFIFLLPGMLIVDSIYSCKEYMDIKDSENREKWRIIISGLSWAEIFLLVGVW